MSVCDRKPHVRLPRARGDRPPGVPRQDPTIAAPPRTRGSPHGEPAGHGGGQGSPAHAGIAPSPWCRTCRPPRLPRARGDRPESGCAPMSLWSAPPRTRGSPPTTASATKAEHGSPAHAGIAPRWRFRRPVARRLPRARGDRPVLRDPRVKARAAPPRTRGSPVRESWRGTVNGGSPAHAGIAPRAPRGSRATPRLPRARGDRPRNRNRRVIPQVAPPRTRGSPRDAPARLREFRGSPAHAGIAPMPLDAARHYVRLPRARGDRPCADSHRRTLELAPPRTRGSPLHPPRARARGGGSPAHAGIAPGPTARATA